MLTIFHAPYTRSLRVLWLCEEMGLPYQVEPASLQNPSPAFLAANPLRTAPALVDGDAVLTESISILLYILGKNGPSDLAVGPDEKGYADYLQFLVFGESGLGMNAGTVVAARMQAPDDEKNNWSVRNAMDRLIERIGIIDAALADGRPFIAGDRFTAADISLGWLLANAEFIGIGDKLPPNVGAYIGRLASRPAFQRAVTTA